MTCRLLARRARHDLQAGVQGVFRLAQGEVRPAAAEEPHEELGRSGLLTTSKAARSRSRPSRFKRGDALAQAGDGRDQVARAPTAQAW